MENELEALLASLTPEQLQEIMGLGTVDARSDIVAQQLAQADALRNAQVGNNMTPGGAALSGMGNLLDKVRGGLETQDLRAQQQGLLGQQDAGRMTYLQALRNKQQPLAALPPDAGALDLSSLLGGGIVS